ncbi:MAG: glycosyltransferase family 4 protein, partial [Kouleothrix sp.]
FDRTRTALATRDEQIEGVQVYRVRSAYWPNGELARALRRGPRPDIIHFMHPRNVLAAQTTAWALKQRIPTVYTWLGPFHDHYLAPDRERPFEVAPTYERLIFSRLALLRRLPIERAPRDLIRNYRLHWPLRMATALAPCSEFEAGMMRKLGMHQLQTMIPLWIDDQSIRTTPRIPPPLSQPRPWLLFVGQITPRKGYDLAVRALPTILAQYPTATLLVVSGLNQAQRSELLQLAQQLGVERHIEMLGFLPDAELVNLFRASDTLLFPTRYEGFGLPLLEAMAAECPIVTTDIPVVREIVTDQQNGLLVAPNDAVALAKATLQLLDTPALRQKLIAGGQATLRTRFAEATLAPQIEQFYRDVVAGAPRHG